MSAASVSIPFLRPSLPLLACYAPYLEEIDRNHWYSNFGPLNQRFEARALQEYFDGNGAIATVGNCTLGLMLAMSALRRPEGKYVVMPSFTFAATALAAVWAGLTPYFVDICPDEWVASSSAISDAVDKLGDEVAAVTVYNTFGTAIPLDSLAKLHLSGIPVIIDAAPSFGARFATGENFGEGFPGAVIYSLHATKPFGIGEGGLVYSGDPAFVERVRRLSNFGFESPGVSAEHGFNAKLPEISAAVGLAVLNGYPEKLQRLEAIYQNYMAEFDRAGIRELAIKVQHIQGEIPHQFIPLLLPADIDVVATEARMREQGVGVRRYFTPSCHHQVGMQAFPCGDLSVTEQVSGRVMCLPLWDGLTKSDVASVVAALRNCF